MNCCLGSIFTAVGSGAGVSVLRIDVAHSSVGRAMLTRFSVGSHVLGGKNIDLLIMKKKVPPLPLHAQHCKTDGVIGVPCASRGLDEMVPFAPTTSRCSSCRSTVDPDGSGCVISLSFFPDNQ